tara:strand:- start:253 stop:672 length:420 start_codon:yes stop_codon:yes gene_type:complete
MVFGIFENKGAKLIRAETLRTLEHADLLSDKDKNKIAKNLFTKLIKYIGEVDGIPPGPKLESIIKKQLSNATKQRQKNITHQEERNPKWIESALLESFLMMNSGVYGAKLAKDSILIGNWCRENMSQKEIEKFENKFSR